MRSEKNRILYQKFKDEAQICTLISTGGVKVTKKTVIRFRGQTYLTGSMSQVFNSIKHKLTLS
jgi:hypothetical protein